MERLSRPILLSKVGEIPAIPVSWYVKRLQDQTLFNLNLRACEIRNVATQDSKKSWRFEFPNIKEVAKNIITQKAHDRVITAILTEVGYHFDVSTNERTENEEEKNFLAITHPELILKVDLSLNEIEDLSIPDLIQFPEMRSLDVSLNAVRSFQGIEAAYKLVYLNLSYNNITSIPNAELSHCVNLQSLDLSINKVSSVVGFPMLPNLIRLHLRNNKLKDLEGLQVLRSIKHVDVADNKITSIVHLCACLELNDLNVANNKLSMVSDIIAAAAPLKRLSQIHLTENPILSNVSLQEIQGVLVRETSITLMDGVNIRPIKTQFQQLSRMQPPRANDEIKIQLKIAIKESMQENLERNRDSIHTCIRHLHEKMLFLLQDLEKQENMAEVDIDAWCRYIDTLSTEEAKSLTVSQIRAAALIEPDGYIPPHAGIPVATSTEKPSNTGRNKYETQLYRNYKHPDLVLNAVAEVLKDQRLRY